MYVHCTLYKKKFFRLNLASLKKYEEMELEAKRKALRSGQREIKGPVIRYLSTSMPAIKVMFTV